MSVASEGAAPGGVSGPGGASEPGGASGPREASEWAERPDELAAMLPSGWEIGVTAWPPFLDPLADPVSDPIARDVELLADLGVDSCALPLHWNALQPDGRGPLDRSVAASLERVLDGMLALGVAPTITLTGPGFGVGGARSEQRYGVPDALAGAWQNRETAERFAEFAYLCAERFGERVAGWTTVAEPAAIIWDGYALGTRPPYRRALFGSIRAARTLLLGHGLAVRALRDSGVSAPIGLTQLVADVSPEQDTEADVAFATMVDILHNRAFSDPVLLGSTPDLEVLPDEVRLFFSAFADFEPSDLEVISTPIDVIGLENRAPFLIGAGSAAAPENDPEQPRFPFHGVAQPDLHLGADGRPQSPRAYSNVLSAYVQRYGEALPPVTGGAGDLSTADEIAAHLAAFVDAADQTGMRIHGFQLGSMTDADTRLGAPARLSGLVGVDAGSRARRPKPVFDWLRAVLADR